MMAINSDPAKAEHFEQIFTRYYRPVSYYFARRGCSRQDCLDLTQETFLGVYNLS
jgi:DNA-directed RNA polymerase specialized sigma24 family protein